MKKGEKKIIRDLVHDYFYLTSFELEIIDSVPFQRLKDIRQLTCQHVYPNARHTRFEHSLGVLELTKRAIRHINRNGFIDASSTDTPIINDSNKFNTQIAALLHDVGHCPFSHMGEVEMDEQEVRGYFVDIIEKKSGIGKGLGKELFDIINRKEKEIGAIHEQLSCIVIFEHYYELLANESQVDFDLIIRCILGIPYVINAGDPKVDELRTKNLCISLINDRAFDMDKLDYIMRDSLYTGIGVPQIDTKRLFRNMKISSDYKIVFLSKAVPALQSIIESRDSLYMWVYNHHSVIYSDFIYSYIFRRLSRNAESLGRDTESLGIIPKNIVFSVKSVVKDMYSDSDVQSILNNQYRLKYIRLDEEDKDIERAVVLIENLLKRQFLKPWWKTVFEFNAFMRRNFSDDSIHSQICKYVSHFGKFGLNPAEFRSQIAKHVIYLTENMYNEGYMLKKLNYGDFFIVQRSNKFFELDTIEKFVIYLKKNEIIDSPSDVVDTVDGYYGKYLTNLLPQRNYSSMYKSDSFYIYVQKFENNTSKCKTDGNADIGDIKEKDIKEKYYNLIEKCFAFVAINLIRNGEIEFVQTYITDPSPQKESEAREKMWEKFRREVLGK